MKYGLTAVGAALPAVATPSYGIRIILDFEGVGERSHRMASHGRARSGRNWRTLKDGSGSDPALSSGARLNVVFLALGECLLMALC